MITLHAHDHGYKTRAYVAYAAEQQDKVIMFTVTPHNVSMSWKHVVLGAGLAKGTCECRFLRQEHRHVHPLFCYAFSFCGKGAEGQTSSRVPLFDYDCASVHGRLGAPASDVHVAFGCGEISIAMKCQRSATIDWEHLYEEVLASGQDGAVTGFFGSVTMTSVLLWRFRAGLNCISLSTSAHVPNWMLYISALVPIALQSNPFEEFIL